MNALRMLVAGVMVCAVTLGGTAAEDKKEEKKDVSKAVVGTWEVTKAEPGTVPVGSVVDFAKDGKIKVTHKADGQDKTVEGTYSVAGNKVTFKLKVGDQERSNTITFTKITDAEASTEDSNGKKVELKKKK